MSEPVNTPVGTPAGAIDPQRRRRRTLVTLLTIPAFVALTILFSQQAFNLTFLRPDSTSQALVFAALSALVFILFLVLCLMIARILLKLFAERRVGKMGSKFRTKLVLGAMVLSFGPVLFLFLFAYGLMNRSIDKWFSTPVEEVRRDTSVVSSTLAEYTLENARAEAVSMAIVPDTEKAFQTGNFAPMMDVFRRREAPLQGGFAVALLDGELEASYQIPNTWAELGEKLRISQGRLNLPTTIDLNGQQWLVGWQEVGKRGLIIVSMPMPQRFSAAIKQMEDSQRNYLDLAAQRKMVRRTYMLLLLLLTSVVLFAATWFAVFMSKFVTMPVIALAEGTQELSRGNLDYRVNVPATDELGELVKSFNRMAEELKSNRQKLESSSRDIAEANEQLEQRRRQIETILENIPTGVLSLDGTMRVTHVNQALTRLFRPEATGSGEILKGAHLRDVFPQEVIDDLAHMLRKSDRMGSTTSQLEAAIGGRTLNLAATVASLKHEWQRLGYVIVFEDLTDLLQAQKQVAWREVARRVAHEIKNPLTPIALSAQRIKRHLERGSVPDEASLAVIHGCAETIAGAVETVRTLVDEFSTMARFPAAQVKPADMNSIVHTALSMFDGRLDGTTVQTSLSPELPKVMADPEAMKRAIANLVDNAAEAMNDSLVREIQITTSVLGSRDVVELVVADTGHGITAENKEKLFLPYFSTKQRGTGLGLAIVSRIVEDHHGSIRVEENKPVGTKFIVEVPVASEAAVESAAHA